MSSDTSPQYRNDLGAKYWGARLVDGIQCMIWSMHSSWALSSFVLLLYLKKCPYESFCKYLHQISEPFLRCCLLFLHQPPFLHWWQCILSLYFSFNFIKTLITILAEGHSWIINLIISHRLHCPVFPLHPLHCQHYYLHYHTSFP